MATRPQAVRQNSKRLAPPSLSFGPPSQEGPASDSPQSPTFSSPQYTGATTTTTTTTFAQPNTRPSPATDHSFRNAPHLQSPDASRKQRQPSATAETWTALQSTLEEVELNALSGASVFGAQHSRALEELRKAQVELARAWARGEADGDGDGYDDSSAVASAGGDGGAKGAAGGAAGSGGTAMVTPGTRSAVLSSDRAGKLGGGGAAAGAREEVKRSGGSYNASAKTKLEEETESDIKMARERRMANDRYFERVNKGVVDVVAKLEVVAQKMGGVEMESQEIWGEDSDSLDSRPG